MKKGMIIKMDDKIIMVEFNSVGMLHIDISHSALPGLHTYSRSTDISLYQLTKADCIKIKEAMEQRIEELEAEEANAEKIQACKEAKI